MEKKGDNDGKWDAGLSSAGHRIYEHGAHGTIFITVWLDHSRSIACGSGCHNIAKIRLHLV